MRLPLFFAKRYLFSKKSVNAINIISSISVIGVLVSSAALLIVLSFYNGMEQFILSQYSVFSPDLRIEPTKGKVFSTGHPIFAVLRKDNALSSYSETLEDKVLVQYQGQQFVGNLKGVEQTSLAIHTADDMLLMGNHTVFHEDTTYAILGAQIQGNLQVPVLDEDNAISIYIPNKKVNPQQSSLNPMDEINSAKINIGGVLKYQQGFDDLIVVPIDFAKELLGERTKISSVEIYLKDQTLTNQYQKKIRQSLGDGYQVKNREQQNPTLYKTISSEKWIVFFIVTIIGVIAIFNIIGSLTMLVIDKKKDMIVLKSMGADKSLIQRIFFYEGVLIALMGSVIGVLLGLAFCLLQQEFGFVKAEGQTLFSAYPVDIRYTDTLMIFLIVMLVSILVSYVASKLSIKNLNKFQLD